MVAYTTFVHAYRNLRAYRHANALASDVFWITRRFPARERHAQTDQLRRTSRALTEHIVDAWANRYAPRAFRYHLDTAHLMGTHLRHGIDRAYDSTYLSGADHTDLLLRTRQVQQLLRRLQEQRIGLLAAGSPALLTA